MRSSSCFALPSLCQTLASFQLQHSHLWIDTARQPGIHNWKGAICNLPPKGKERETGIRLFKEWEWITSQGSTEGGAQPGLAADKGIGCFPAELGHPPLPPALPYSRLLRHKPPRISRHKPLRIIFCCSFPICISIFKFEEEEKKPQIQCFLESTREACHKSFDPWAHL